MRKVVDSNYLLKPELDAYLSASKHNAVVLIDYVAIEAYKCNDIDNFINSMSILSKYPKQVCVLKCTINVCGLKPKLKGLEKRFISRSQTQGFEQFCKDLNLARNGNSNIRDQITKFQNLASEQIENMLNDTDGVIDSIKGIVKEYKDSELKIIRSNKPYTGDIKDKILKHILLMSVELFKNHPSVSKLPEFHEIIYSYIFRYSLSMYLLVLYRISNGSSNTVQHKTFFNDIVDMHFVAYATIFDGLLSDDKNTNLIFEIASNVIRNLSKA